MGILIQCKPANGACWFKPTSAYLLIIMSRDADPDVLVAARLGSPLMLGIGEDEWFSNLMI